MLGRLRRNRKPIEDWQIWLVGTFGIAFVGLTWGNPKAILFWFGAFFIFSIVTITSYVWRTTIEEFVKKMEMPTSFEIQGTHADEGGVKWFIRNFGNRSLPAMSISDFAIGFVVGILMVGLLGFSKVDAVTFGLMSIAFYSGWLLILRYNSKKVAQ
jgi:hypothetical protein